LWLDQRGRGCYCHAGGMPKQLSTYTGCFILIIFPAAIILNQKSTLFPLKLKKQGKTSQLILIYWFISILLLLQFCIAPGQAAKLSRTRSYAKQWHNPCRIYPENSSWNPPWQTISSEYFIVIFFQIIHYLTHLVNRQFQLSTIFLSI
jgi:hypothetical protein